MSFTVGACLVFRTVLLVCLNTWLIPFILLFFKLYYRSVWIEVWPGTRPSKGHSRIVGLMRDSTCPRRLDLVNIAKMNLSHTDGNCLYVLHGYCLHDVLQLRGNHPCVLLAEQGRGKNFIVYKPNIGKQTHPESLENLRQRYRKVKNHQILSITHLKYHVWEV